MRSAAAPRSWPRSWSKAGGRTGTRPALPSIHPIGRVLVAVLLSGAYIAILVVISKFEDILTDVDEALDFARSLREKVAGSRFELYRDRIAEWFRLAPQRGLPEPSDRDDGLDSVALTEAVELGQEIVPFLRDVGPAIAANKLRHVLHGADRPGDDDPDSAMGRNTAFEISLAGTFRRARIPVKLGEPDLVAQIGRRQVFIACKRPFGPAGVERNFMRAEEQVKTR